MLRIGLPAALLCVAVGLSAACVRESNAQTDAVKMKSRGSDNRGEGSAPAMLQPEAPGNEGPAPQPSESETKKASIDAGREIFAVSCFVCHTLGDGNLVGPDLKGLEDRVPSREWAVAYTLDPQSAEDDYAMQLRQVHTVAMTPSSLSDGQANNVIDFIYASGS